MSENSDNRLIGAVAIQCAGLERNKRGKFTQIECDHEQPSHAVLIRALINGATRVTCSFLDGKTGNCELLHQTVKRGKTEEIERLEGDAMVAVPCPFVEKSL